ncbi:hypothetical protein ACRYCC_21135 [Actinomadura scrupuli]|uniref:hypothetical protein n=1 Tax=Actinomadura scrupuli TaxID=559629 RepID=UPI003D957F80
MPDLIAAPFALALTRELCRSALPGAPVVAPRRPRRRWLRRRSMPAPHRFGGHL